MAVLVLLGPRRSATAAVASLDLLAYAVRRCPLNVDSVIDLIARHSGDVVMIDASRHADLLSAKGICGLIRHDLPHVPVVLLVSDGGIGTVRVDWGMDEVILPHCGPIELSARIRLASQRRAACWRQETERPHTLAVGAVSIDTEAITATVNSRPLQLTYLEFELLRFMCEQPGRIFSRYELLEQVWGYDYHVGETRTVDVHVRRLRSKLRPEAASLILTVRNVGYGIAAG